MWQFTTGIIPHPKMSIMWPLQLYSCPGIKIPGKIRNVEYMTRASSPYMTQSSNYSDSNSRSRDIGSERGWNSVGHSETNHYELLTTNFQRISLLEWERNVEHQSNVERKTCSVEQSQRTYLQAVHFILHSYSLIQTCSYRLTAEEGTGNHIGRSVYATKKYGRVPSPVAINGIWKTRA